MSFRDNQDLRVREKGGYFYGEHELFSVFAPIIGPLGLSVYMAFCRLVPLAGIHSDKPVTVRRLSEHSCVGRTACAELMQQILRLGMVLETRYLDGRDPSYKLVRLDELAKCGQKELLERIGVRHTDTAPFDQEAKHREARERRIAKTRLERVDMARERRLPLLERQPEAGEAGVRHTDTEAEATADADPPPPATDDNQLGVRHTDTVSAKTASVSAKTVHVTAWRQPIKGKKRSEEEQQPPLPPAGRGEGEAAVREADVAEGAVGEEGEAGGDGDPRPVLPVSEASVGSPGFEQALPAGARWVMARLGITKRRMQPEIEAQLRVWCREHRGETLEAGCARMSAAGLEMHRNRHLLRHGPWSWRNFIAEGHWARPLPYDRARAEALVGMAKPESGAADAPEGEPRRWEAYVGNHAHLVSMAGLSNFGTRLLALAEEAGAGRLDATALDGELQRIQDEIVAELSEWQGEAEMAARRERFADGQREMLRFLPVGAREEAVRRAVERDLLAKAGVPMLSLFYMGRRS